MTPKYTAQISRFKALAHPVRLQILDMLRDGEVCVCHMEKVLNKRQAYISQQLMRLREAGLVEDRREGMNVYYRLGPEQLAPLLDLAQAVTEQAQPPERPLRFTAGRPVASSASTITLIWYSPGGVTARNWWMNCCPGARPDVSAITNDRFRESAQIASAGDPSSDADAARTIEMSTGRRARNPAESASNVRVAASNARYISTSDCSAS